MERGKVFMGVMVALLIFLSVTLFLAVAGSRNTSPTDLWSFSVNDSKPWTNMYVDDEGTFYTAMGESIKAIGADGTVRWSLPLDYQPETISGISDKWGRVYLTVFSGSGPDGRGGDLMAVSPEGRVLWNLQIPPMGSSPLAVAGDRLFKYTENRYLGAYDCNNGSLLWSVYVPHWTPAIDTQGNLYVEYDEYNTTIDQFIGELRSYDPDGQLRWAHNFSDYGVDYREIGYGRLRALNDTLLMTDGFGLAAADFNGTFLWHRNTSYGATIYDVDEEGVVYMICWNGTTQTSRNLNPALRYPDFEVIRPDGTAQRIDGRPLVDAMGEFHGIYGGIAYYAMLVPGQGNRTQYDTGAYNLYAYDLEGTRVSWMQRIAFSPMTVVLNASNIGSIVTDNVDIYHIRKYNNLTSENLYEWMDPETPGLKDHTEIRVVDGSDVTYVVYWAYNFMTPVVLNQSTCTYAGGICAVDDSGRLTWSRSTDSWVTSVTEKNGTVYYKTYDGRFSAASADVATGFVLAAVYLFFRFFLFGAVSRARSRLDKNANRNMVLAFVVENPGASLYEIARALGMNVGTVRYHLLILSMNHKVSASGNSPKSVGYFACSRLYTDEEKLLMSMARREQVRALLGILSSQPGLTNAEIATEVGLAESAVSRYMIELNRRGIVAKRRMENGKLTYCIVEQFEPAMATFFSRDGIGYANRRHAQEMPVADLSR